jgi:four helix bundle protein
MFLQLAHKKLNVYQSSQALALECYKVTRQFPNNEKFAMVQQIRRAALLVHLNLSEGNSRKSQVERNRFYEMARGSVIEIDAALEIAYLLEYASLLQLQLAGEKIIATFNY